MQSPNPFKEGALHGRENKSAMARHFPQLVVFLMLLNTALSVHPGDTWRVLRDRSLVLRTVLSAIVLVPLFTVVLTFIDAVPHSTQVALALLAAAPGAPLASKRAAALGSTVSTAMALQLLVANLGVITAPLTILAIATLHGVDLHISPTPLAQQLFLVQVVPLSLGAFLRYRATDVAVRISKPLSRIANIAMLVLCVMMVGKLLPFLREFGGATWLALLAFSAFALTVGHALGGPGVSTRRAVAICSANRNLGMAILLGSLIGETGVGLEGKHASPYIMTFAFVNFVVGTVYAALTKGDGGDASAPPPSA